MLDLKFVVLKELFHHVNNPDDDVFVSRVIGEYSETTIDRCINQLIKDKWIDAKSSNARIVPSWNVYSLNQPALDYLKEYASKK